MFVLKVKHVLAIYYQTNQKKLALYMAQENARRVVSIAGDLLNVRRIMDKLSRLCWIMLFRMMIYIIGQPYHADDKNRKELKILIEDSIELSMLLND